MLRPSRLVQRMLPPVLLASLPIACEGPPAGSNAVLATFVTTLDPDVPVGGEIYECRLFAADQLQGAAVHGLRWTPPSGSLLLHHAMLFVTSAPATPGPWPCQPMPPAVAVLPLYAPGGETSTFANGVSIVIPSSGESLFVEMHLYRSAVGSSSVSIDLLAGDTPPAHVAGWVDDPAEVPMIPPHTMATSTASCRFGGPVHVVASWPHMHELGAHFESTIIRADGARELLLSVPNWDFAHQPLHDVDAILADGDAIETACSWNNETDRTVLPGPFSGDEMCNQGLVVWPVESAVCLR